LCAIAGKNEMNISNSPKKDDPVRRFAEELISNSHRLAGERVEDCLMSVEKYRHLRDFVQILAFNCYSMTTVLEDNGEINNKQFSFVFFEHLNFFIFLVDRMASTVLDVEERSQLMRELSDFAFVLSIVTLLPDLEDDAKDKLYHQCKNNLIALIEEYSKYDVIQTEDDGGGENTAVWEFSKKIQEFTTHPDNAGAMIGYGYPIIQALKNIDIKSFLQKMK
jgi:hypothetical protein